jgi:glucokinase
MAGAPGVDGAGELVAGVDVGGTKTLAVVVDGGEPTQVVAEVRRPTEATGAAGVLATVTDALVQVTAAAGTSAASLAAVGVGVPGIVDPATGAVRLAVNLGIGEEAVDLLGGLRPLVGDRLVVANDVDLAALAASELLGTGGDVAYLSIGTGVAAGFVIRGEMHQGMLGAAGEIGHLPMAPDGSLCECGQRGCLETVASGTAIARRWRAVVAGRGDAAGTPPDTVVAGSADAAYGAGRAGQDGDDAGDGAVAGSGAAAEVFAAAAGGDETAVALRDEICGYLAATVAVIGQTVDPAHVVLGGGVAEVGAPLLDGVRAVLRRRAGASPLLSALALDQRVTLLPTDAPAGALGAALAARRLPAGDVASSGRARADGADPVAPGPEPL